MVLPIPVGTVLRQRYVIQRILGQGGFGRTYLAIDQERFDERCVLKEFVVPYQDEAQIEKSRTLFQREASILYQIQHPQVPRFWAAFEDDRRLFLVQDYIEGQTYRQLLSDRKQQQRTFSEAEVIHFLSQLLPVLTYLHDREIIHRDITPENVILKPTPAANPELPTTESGLPVLIDFGAVKEATGHWPLASGLTRVGKVGYAPPEQLQTGKVYPNSDVYALGASSLALLTGKEPQALLDGQTLTWSWGSYPISEQLGKILKKMLAFYPGDRYSSASAVLVDLQPLLNHPVGRTELPALSNPGDLSRMPTGYSPRSASYPSPVFSQPDPFDPETHPHPHRLSRLTGFRSFFRLGIAAIALVSLGIATPILWNWWSRSTAPNGDVWISGAKVSSSEASRIMEPGNGNSNSAVRPSATPSPNTNRLASEHAQAKLIQFSPGEITTTLQGNLPEDGTQMYLLEAAQGQIMTATLEGSGVAMNLLRSNQAAIDASAYQTRSWTGQLLTSDRYLIQVTGTGTYSLEVAITPLSRPRQEQTQRVTFERGSNGTTVTGKINPQQVQRYLLEVKQGQILVVKKLQGNLNWSVIAPNGQRVGGSAGNTSTWQGAVNSDGDYVIELSATQASAYALSLEVF